MKLFSMYYNSSLGIKLAWYIASLVAFLLPIYPKILPFSIFLMCLIFLIVFNWKRCKDFLFVKGKLESLILFTSLYFIYVIGLFYTSNTFMGLRDLETKFSIFLMPLLFILFAPRFTIEREFLLVAYVLGCIVAALICFGNVLFYLIKVKYFSIEVINIREDILEFFAEGKFSLWIHPSYRGIYFIFAIIFLLWYIEKKRHKAYAMYFFIFCIVILSLFILFSVARVSMLILLFTYIGYFLYLVILKRKVWKGISFLSFFLIVVLLFYLFFPPIQWRLGKVFAGIRQLTADDYSEEFKEERVLLWQIGLKVAIANLPFGVGTGDVKDALLPIYQQNNMFLEFNKQMNPHNQYLQTSIALGAMGLTALLCNIIIPLIVALRRRDFLYAMFLIIISFAFLFESILETQAGVVFYAFFNSFLWSSYKLKQGKTSFAKF